MADKVLVTNGPAKDGQNTNYEVVTQFASSNRSLDGKKVRVLIRRDNSYAFQSSYAAFVWTGNAWSKVASLLPTEESVKADGVFELAARLLEDARKILR